MEDGLRELNQQVLQVKWGIIALCFFLISLIYKKDKK
tara:strand:+ start:262 stop:372 length:111 start_codon:yes stop_codon:yes gene_type:complete